MYRMFNKPIISSHIKSKRLEWVGRIWRSEGMAKKNVYWKTERKKDPGGDRVMDGRTG